MTDSVISNMAALGFRTVANGGGTMVLVLDIGARQIVASGVDGDLPSADWFTIAAYDGRWTDDVEVPCLLSVTVDEIGEVGRSTVVTSPIDAALSRVLAAIPFTPAPARSCPSCGSHAPAGCDLIHLSPCDAVALDRDAAKRGELAFRIDPAAI